MNRPADSISANAALRLRHGLREHFSSLASLVMRGLGVATGFLVTYLVGRWFGPQGNGQFALITQTGMLLSLLAVSGLDLAATREFSKAVSERRRLARSTLMRTTLVTTLQAVVIMVFLLIWGHDLFNLLGWRSIVPDAIPILCLILLARTLTRFLSAVLRSQTDYVLSQSVEALFIPLGTIALVAVARPKSVDGILWATAAAGILAALIGLAAALRRTGRDDALEVPSRILYATALPLAGVALTQNFADWYGLATVGRVCSVYDAGLYRVATQFAMVFPLISTGMFSTFGARISAAHHAGDKQRVAELASAASRLAVAWMAPFVILGLIFAKPIMGIIGPEFIAGATLLRILLIGQVAIAIASPAGLVLALTGHPRVNLAITASSALLMLLCAPIAAHALGATGIAIFAAALLTGQNIAALAMVRRLEGIDALLGRITARGTTSGSTPRFIE